MATYYSSPKTLANGEQQDLRVDSTGALVTSGAGATAASPSYERSVGSDNLATSQAATSISPATSLLLVAARAGRRSVTITNITGTQPIFIKTTASIDGATTGFFLAAAVGASITLAYTGALYGTSPTAAQSVAIAETY